MAETQVHSSGVTGWGADRDVQTRPGVPAELTPPEPVANAHWLVPEPQQSQTVPLIGFRRQLTPVYSTAVPPRGLSGLIRRLAYGIPEHKARRWLLLLMADRVDVVEHNPVPRALFLGAGALALTALVARVARSS